MVKFISVVLLEMSFIGWRMAYLVIGGFLPTSTVLCLLTKMSLIPAIYLIKSCGRLLGLIVVLDIVLISVMM